MKNAAGLPAYEVSNHARGPQFESRHNHVYWASGDWIGVGPGAHGRLTYGGIRHSTECARRPTDYQAGTPSAVAELSQRDTAQEYLAMALRPVSGMDLARYETLFSRPADAETLQTLAENGHATLADGTLKLTRQGRLIADYVASLLVPY